MARDLEAAAYETIGAVEREPAFVVGVDVCRLALRADADGEGDAFCEVGVALCGVEHVFADVGDGTPEAAAYEFGFLVGDRVPEVEIVGSCYGGPRGW